MEITKAIATAPAKIIITGEHFCVYGKPAIAMAIDLHSKVTVSRWKNKGLKISVPPLNLSGIFVNDKFKSEVDEKGAEFLLKPIKVAVDAVFDYAKKNQITIPPSGLNLEVNCNIPIGVGLGSSAAVAVSTVAAVSKLLGFKLDKDKICDLAYVSECYVHGKPSGIDQTTCTFGGAILFQTGKPFKKLKLKKSLPIIVGNTGIIRSTGEIVEKVHNLVKRKKKLMYEIINSAGEISLKAAQAIEAGNLRELGNLMNENQNMLSAIGISNHKLDMLIDIARKAGAYGAKLTGGGGGGCMIALVNPKKCKKIIDALSRNGGEAFKVKIHNQGVQSWLEN
jgi:mevalonate kinase